MRRDYTRQERLERASLRAALHIREVWEETGRSDTRLLEALVLPDELVLAGRSRAINGMVRREHVVPRLRVIKECLSLIAAKRPDAEVAALIRRLVRIVHVAPEEAGRLDRARAAGGTKQDMPKGWTMDGDVYARLSEAGILWDEIDLPVQPDTPNMLEAAPEHRMTDDLYNRDFYFWTQAQAEALRAHGRSLDNLDYDHIAEELEDLGRSQRHKAESLVRQIIGHLYKLSVSRNPYPQNHWAGEVIEFRLMLEGSLAPSVRMEIEADLEAIHRSAFRVAECKMAAFEPDVTINGAQRWSLSQVLGEAGDPLPLRRTRQTAKQ